MRKLMISLIAALAIVFASAFVFRDASVSTTLSATQLDYMTAEQNGYDFSYLKTDDIKSDWEQIKVSWEDLQAQFQDTSIAEFFDNLDFGGSLTSDDFRSNVKDFFGNFKI